MICYKDMTFCRFYKDCLYKDECHRPLTEEVQKAAEERSLPVSEFLNKPDCHVGDNEF